MVRGRFSMKNIRISLDAYKIEYISRYGIRNIKEDLLYRLESIDDESKSTVIEEKVNKLSRQIDQLKSDLSDVASLFHAESSRSISGSWMRPCSSFRL